MMNIRRWLLLAAILASFWPRIISTALFFLDDRVGWDSANEFDALALIFTVFPLALIGHAVAWFRRSPDYSGIVILLALAALVVSSVPAIVSAYSGGLGASSKQDVEGIEWATVASLTVLLFLVFGLLIATYYSVRGVLMSFGSSSTVDNHEPSNGK